MKPTPSDAPDPTADEARKREPEAPAAKCRRCGQVLPINDDGFCDRCEGELEQACL